MDPENASLEDLRVRVNELKESSQALRERKTDLELELKNARNKHAKAEARRHSRLTKALPWLVLCTWVLAGAASVAMIFSGLNNSGGPGFRVAGSAQAVVTPRSFGDGDGACQVAMVSMAQPNCTIYAACGTGLVQTEDICPAIGEVHHRISFPGDRQVSFRNGIVRMDFTQVIWRAYR